MPYLFSAAATAHERGVPVMRPMLLEFPDDPAVAYLDRQYMLGPDLLVVPVFSADGDVEFYLPHGRWTRLDPTLAGADDETIDGGRWVRETHALDSLPLFVREGAVIPIGATQDRPDYDYLEGLTLELFPGDPGARSVRVVTPDWQDRTITVESDGTRQTVRLGDSMLTTMSEPR
jgi:alpha-D-xyloside xylohydrolase